MALQIMDLVRIGILAQSELTCFFAGVAAHILSLSAVSNQLN